MYKYGLIGNCQVSALISEAGSIDWLCMPRPDSPPIFGKLLDPDGGYFSIEPTEEYTSKQEYMTNTNVLVTTITTKNGAEFRIKDFAPRFMQYNRQYRPLAIFRIVEPIKGANTIQVKISPVSGWDKKIVKPVRGNSHLRYHIGNDVMRLITNMPLTYLYETIPFSLTETIYFGLTWSFGIEDDLIDITNDFYRKTVGYWRKWVQRCSIPSLYQKETIRSALALKLHCYEDTGAILASISTSLPEEKGAERNWDYRFCWLRDAYFTLSAFYNLGHFSEIEDFLKFLIGVIQKSQETSQLLPVYALDQTLPLPEYTHPEWAGYNGSIPVRSNNQAGEHTQNDVYGEMVLTLSTIFLDERFHHLRTKELEATLQNLVTMCIKSISQPDAGLWELRNVRQEHSFTNLMCWAGIDKAIKIKKTGALSKMSMAKLLQAKAKAEKAINSAIEEGTLRNGPEDKSFDSSLFLLPILRYPKKELSVKTVQTIRENLKFADTDEGKYFFFRYKRKDDFGKPQSAFLICSFWLVQALAKLDQIKDARTSFKKILRSYNHLGLYAEHYIPEEKEQLGNFPQAYSHVGQINAAFAISPPWDEVL